MTEDVIEGETIAQKVVRHWNTGLSGPNIGKILGISHGRVAGIIHREKNKGTVLRDAKIRYDRTVKQARPAQPPKEPPVIKPDPEKPEALGEEVDLKAVAFMDRQPSLRARGQLDIPFDGTSRHRCQWPSWTIESKTGDMCGLSVSNKSIPYCSFHMRCAYNPLPKRTR